MGTDKAFIEIDGRTMLEIAVAALREGGATEGVVVGGACDAVERLGLRWVADEFPGEGPLGGLITALDTIAHLGVADPEPGDTPDGHPCAIGAVLACDHLATEGPAVRTIVGALGHADAAIPVVDGMQQVLHAAWRTRARGHLRQRFLAGARSVRDGAVGLDVVHLLDGDPCWFADADTPADVEQYLGRHGGPPGGATMPRNAHP